MNHSGPYPKLNFAGSDWGVMKQWLEQDVLDAYKRLARLDCTEAETQQLRGRIILLEQQLGWPQLAATLTTQGVFNAN